MDNLSAHGALVLADVAKQPLLRLIAELEDALRKIEAHHVKQNAAKGRDESESYTLRICREALAK